MSNYGTYCDLTKIKAALVITDTTDDTLLMRALEAASRWIDGETFRYFYTVSETRYFTAKHGGYLIVDDLLSISTFKTDDDGDRTYENTWAVTDYDLEPYQGYPKTRISTTPEGDYTFPTVRKGVEIAGVWGFGNGSSATPYENSNTTLNEALDASETGVDVAAGTAIAAGQNILIESEQMYVQSISTNTLTVIRGVNGTTAATHATGKDVYKYAYPRDIRRACIRLAQRTYRLESAPFGTSGGQEMGSVDVVASAGDRDIWGWLNPFRKLAVG